MRTILSGSWLMVVAYVAIGFLEWLLVNPEVAHPGRMSRMKSSEAESFEESF